MKYCPSQNTPYDEPLLIFYCPKCGNKYADDVVLKPCKVEYKEDIGVEMDGGEYIAGVGETITYQCNHCGHLTESPDIEYF